MCRFIIYIKCRLYLYYIIASTHCNGKHNNSIQLWKLQSEEQQHHNNTRCIKNIRAFVEYLTFGYTFGNSKKKNLLNLVAVKTFVGSNVLYVRVHYVNFF